MNKVALGRTTITATPTIAGSFVAEGAPIPVRQGGFDNVTITPKKIAAIAVVSATSGTPARAGLVAIGEVGLTGELRSCVGVQRRLQEAARLGFTVALVPEQGLEDLHRIEGMYVRPVSDLATALEFALP